MTYISALFWTIGAYVLLGVLLLSLNLASLWRWWVKAAAIVLTTAAFAGAYFALNGLLGWPAIQAPPDRFSLVGTRIIEPDKAVGSPGRLYMWLEEVDEKNLPIAAPRAFEVAYTPAVADALLSAQGKLDQGEQVLGEMLKKDESDPGGDPSGDSPPGKAPDESEGKQGKVLTGAGGSAMGAAIFLVDVSTQLQLSDMPPPQLPGKR